MVRFRIRIRFRLRNWVMVRVRLSIRAKDPLHVQCKGLIMQIARSRLTNIQVYMCVCVVICYYLHAR